LENPASLITRKYLAEFPLPKVSQNPKFLTGAGYPSAQHKHIDWLEWDRRNRVAEYESWNV
jgi:hypothetical protein